MSEDPKMTLEEAQLKFAKKINGRAWELLDKSDRSHSEDEEMVHAAHASLFHWLYAGSAVHHQRGVWMIARVQTVLGNAQEALRYAQRCLELTEQHGDEMEDFDLAFAYECAARAHALAGNRKEAENYLQLARQAGTEVADEENRKVFFDDLEGGEWYGVR